MNPAMLDKPFFEVTLPLMLTIIAGIWAMISTNNRRLDDIIQRLDRMDARFAASRTCSPVTTNGSRASKRALRRYAAIGMVSAFHSGPRDELGGE